MHAVEDTAQKKGIRPWLALCILLLLAISIVLRAPKTEAYNFHCADATYHVLLTMEAYDQTDARIHRFLPIVSLGAEDDKYIPWGATVPDAYGNYYYASFPPAGFAVPYLFVKLFHLPINEFSLYCFNSILYVLSFVLAAMVFLHLFKGQLNSNLILALVAMVYLFQPEIMHGQGIVYWHHSLFQPLFLLQLYCFLHLKERSMRVGFLCLCFLVPTVEWSGYFGNIGFALAVFLSKDPFGAPGTSRPVVQKLIFTSIIAFLTALSLVVFACHFLMVLPLDAFARAIYQRFMARNVTNSNVSIFGLLKTYGTSYGLLLLVLGALLVLTLAMKKPRMAFWETIKRNAPIVCVLLFLWAENVVLLQHAIGYSFDRMKVVFLLIFIALAMVAAMQETYKRKAKAIGYSTATALALMAAGNLLLYCIPDNHYLWKVDYLASNKEIAASINAEYTHENSLFAHALVATRGYSNYLFGRGIYEALSLEQAKEIVMRTNKQYIVWFECLPQPGSLYDYSTYQVYDMESME